MAEKDIFGFGKYENIHAKFAKELKDKYAVISVLKTIISAIFLVMLYIQKIEAEKIVKCNGITWWDFWGLLIALIVYRMSEIFFLCVMQNWAKKTIRKDKIMAHDEIKFREDYDETQKLNTFHR